MIGRSLRGTDGGWVVLVRGAVVEIVHTPCFFSLCPLDDAHDQVTVVAAQVVVFCVFRV